MMREKRIKTGFGFIVKRMKQEHSTIDTGALSDK